MPLARTFPGEELDKVQHFAQPTFRQVLQFLYDLVAKAKKSAELEIKELRDMAKADGIEELESWDLAFYSEKLRKAKYDIQQEDLRYFSE